MMSRDSAQWNHLRGKGHSKRLLAVVLATGLAALAPVLLALAVLLAVVLATGRGHLYIQGCEKK